MSWTAVAERLKGSPGGGSQVTLGGQRIPLDGAGNGTSPGDTVGSDTRENAAAADTLAALADRISGDGAGTGRVRLGRPRRGRRGEASGLSVDGDVTTFTLGADVTRGALARRGGAGPQHRRGWLPRPRGAGRPSGPRLGRAGEHAGQRASLSALRGQRASLDLGHPGLRQRRSLADGRRGRRYPPQDLEDGHADVDGGGGGARRAVVGGGA